MSGCRLPGGVSSASELWEFLKEGRNGHGEVPESRFNIDGFYSPKPNRPGSLTMRKGYFIDQNLQDFDNAFFGINNLEATYMDPKQRLLLEVVYECFESAGIKLSDIAEKNVGCFVGNFTNDAQIMQARDWEYPHRFTATGFGTTILSNRISHIFDLRGPSVTLDTACSSSLYCLHFACRALSQGDCNSAIVAAANLLQGPEYFMSTSAAGVLSDTGICHSFAANADGYGRADAIGALYLKRLSDAIRDNDPIRSIIRGTSVNANGRTPGITLPSSVGQENVIAQAYNYAGINQQDIGYVECHGTGTPVGDPIEVEAVANFYTKPLMSHAHSRSLLIGSVKSNFGHSEAASGLTSVMKTTLALKHLEIPPTVGIESLNPRIPWEQYNVEVVRSFVPWPTLRDSKTPTAGVNSFGYGGANSHCILERASTLDYADGVNIKDTLTTRCFVLPISAKCVTALEARVEDLMSMDLAKIDPRDMAYTFAERRELFNWRGFLIVENDTLATDIKIEALRPTVRRTSTKDLPLAFVFTGQGAQWPQMGKKLIERYTQFHDSIMRLQGELSLLPDPPKWSLCAAILKSPAESDIHNPVISQTTCTAIQIALVDLLLSWDILPDIVIGHSSGEIAAAYAAGHLSSFDAMAVAYVRGLVVCSGPSDGAMIAVGMSHEVAQELIHAHGASSEVSIACINSPTSVTLSGDSGTIDMLLQSIQRTGEFARKLKTGGKAYHSYHMKRLGETYESHLWSALQTRSRHDQNHVSKKLDVIRENTSMISSVLSRQVSAEVTSLPSYWRTNLESPVNFYSAIELALKNRDYQFIEIGPHSALEMPVKQTRSYMQKGEDGQYLSALLRGKDSEKSLLSLVSHLWTLGYPIQYAKVNSSLVDGSSRKCRVLTDLPNYRWDHSEKLWKEPRTSYELRRRQYPRDDLLGSRIPGSNGITNTWRNMLSAAEISWLQDHKLADDVVFPAAGYFAMVSRAAQQLGPTEVTRYVLEIRNAHIMEALVLSPDSPIELFTELMPKRYSDLNDSPFWWHFIISTFDAGQSKKHASGDIGFVPSHDVIDPIKPIIVNESEAQHSRIWYSQFSKIGLNFGPTFRSLSEISLARMRNQTASRASLMNLPKGVEDERRCIYPFEIHPITIDAQVQAGTIAKSTGDPEKLEPRVPVFVELVQIWPGSQHYPLSECIVNASCTTVGFGVDVVQAELLSAQTDQISRLHNVKAVPFHGTMETKPERHPMLRVQWRPDISKINSCNAPGFASYIDRQVCASQNGLTNGLTDTFRVILELISHCRSELEILQLGSFQKPMLLEMMESLGSGGSFQRFRTFSWGQLDERGHLGSYKVNSSELQEEPPQLRYEDTPETTAQTFDIILLTDSVDLGHSPITATTLKAHLKADGKLLIAGNLTGKALFDLGFETLEICPQAIGPVTLALSGSTSSPSSDLSCHTDTILVVNDDSHPLNLALACRLGVKTTHIQDLGSLSIPEKSKIIITAELEESVLSCASENQFAAIQKITNNASKLLWVTGGNLAESQDPDVSLVLGLARTLMGEQPSLESFVIDIDKSRDRLDLTVSNLLTILESNSAGPVDHEYI